MAERLMRKPLPDEISKEQWFNECLREYQKWRMASERTRGNLAKEEEAMFYFLQLMEEARSSEDGKHIVRFVKDEEGRLSFVVERK